MHYCYYLFTKNLPSKNEIEQIMSPFNEETYYDKLIYNEETGDYDNPNNVKPPIFLWDWFEVGGRYGGHIKLKVQYDVEDEYKWKFYAKEPREGRLFICNILKTLRKNESRFGDSEEMWFPYLGDGSYISVDGAYVKDIANIDKLGCCGYIDVDGIANVRETWDREARKFIENEAFDAQFKETLEKRSDCFVTVIDAHD